jgi:prepilin-type N-terminal cleavage/methylation domain-containing protein
MSRRHIHRAFTLVELLVVIGIIALLMALFTGAVMWAVNAARRTRMSVEISALQDAIEKYKTKVGDYPPNFRDASAVIRHIRTRYPKIAASEFTAVIDMTTTPPSIRPAMQLDEGESLVFWLAGTRNDPIYPFGLTGGQQSAMQTYYEFDQRRLVDLDPNPVYTGDTTYTLNGYPSIPSYQAAYAKETFYLYLDSRSYDDLVLSYATDATTGAYGEIDATLTTITHDMVTRPYLADTGTPSNPFMNPTSFQILCAGQDGLWGNVDPTTGNPAPPRSYPGGLNYTQDEMDNITNFTEGGTLEDKLP